jgi:hypothetical protein
MGKNSRPRHVDEQAVSEQHQPPGASGAPASDAYRQLERMLGLVLRDRMWTRGWQPDELVRQITRAGGQVGAEALAMAITADTAYHDRVGHVINASWRRQTDRIAGSAGHEPARDGWLARWLHAAGDDIGTSTVRVVLEALLRLPALPRLIPPPGAPDAAHGDLHLLDEQAAPSPKLVTIRGLLAKAESSQFPAEAEAFTAKAQAMMIETRLDEATVRAGRDRESTGRVSAVRLAIDEPYVASKQSLLHVVAEANDVRCVFHRSVDLATLVGPVGQLAHVELLFTSLLIQVQSAMATDAADAPPGSRVRSRRYRSSFIVGFAGRVGERLRQACDTACAAITGDALPVLAADDRATTELFERLVGPTTRFRSSARYDAAGVSAGKGAADRAALREAGLRGPANGASGALRDAGRAAGEAIAVPAVSGSRTE